MFMPSISLDASAAATAAGDPAGTAGTAVSEDGAAFAQRLALAQAALPPGQNLAAGGLPLQALALGPTLEVVTATADGPDADALAEFAKAQGLDEDVVAWLFADPAAMAQAVAPLQPGLVAGLATPVVLSDGAQSTAPLTQASLAAGAGTGLPGASGLLPGAVGVPADAQAAAALAALAAAADAAPALPAWLQQPMGPGTATHLANPDASANPDGAAPVAMHLQSFAAAMAAAADQAAGSQSATNPDATRAAQAPQAEVLSVEIDVEPGLEALWEPDTGAAPAAGAADAGSAGSSGSGRDPGAAGAQALPDDAPATTLAQRAQGYQALAERLGEAVAQRVLSQFEKGNWQVKLLLKPEKLGEVEIDLKMKAGQVDAAFQASNAVTRDLLNDGLPKLREVLNNAGMDIADLNVGTGRGQQTGGNPTPRQSASAAAPGASAEAQAPDTAASAAPAPRRASSASGWDVVV